MSDWTRSFLGDDVVLSSSRGTVRIRPRFGRLRPLKLVLGEIMPGLVLGGPGVEGPFGIATAEGEYGAIVNVVTPQAQRTVAVVFGDHHVASIDGVTRDPAVFAELRETVRRLAFGHAMGLGSDRWRPYFFQPPPGWVGVRKHHATLFISPSAPREHALLTVFDARPSQLSVATHQERRMFEQLGREFGESRPSEPFSFETEHRLAAQIITYSGVVEGRELRVSDLVLSDSRHIYPVRLETTADLAGQHRPALEKLAATVRALPAPQNRIDVLVHWSD